MKKIKYIFLAFMTVVMLSNVLWGNFSIEELRMFVVKFIALISLTYAVSEFIDYIYEQK